MPARKTDLSGIRESWENLGGKKTAEEAEIVQNRGFTAIPLPADAPIKEAAVICRERLDRLI